MPLVRQRHVKLSPGKKLKIGGNLESIRNSAVNAAINKAVNITTEYIQKNGVNMLINNLPFEAHLLDYNNGGIRKYSYCGPGTKLGDSEHPGRLTFDKQGNVIKINSKPINELDNACMAHDIAYEKKDIESRNRADEVLKLEADLFKKQCL